METNPNSTAVAVAVAATPDPSLPAPPAAAAASAAAAAESADFVGKGVQILTSLFSPYHSAFGIRFRYW
eukprot:scaffold7969_cov295-Alexandrium_tamarense.AAC.1